MHVSGWSVLVGRRKAVTLAALAGYAVLASAVASGPPIAARQACPNPPVPSIGSPTAPDDVCIPAGFPGNPIDFFDDFSWRAFIAMVWPATAGQRGVADTARPLGAAGPRVFETYKAQWEVFHADGSKPSDWNTYDTSNACGATVQFGDVVLASFSKFSDIGQAGFGNLIGPLVAQNRTYVRYLTGMNRPEFELIQSKGLYLRKNLPAAPNALTFPNGSIDVKSAWIDMTGIGHPERYYTRGALVMDPAPGAGCTPKTVGLIALHIVVKTPSMPQWIWSSFEQVDLIPQPEAMAPFALNAGDKLPLPDENPFPIDPPITPPPAPFNVTRVKPIHEATQKTNAAYRQRLAAGQSVWRFYQLVMTQWPLKPNSPETSGKPENTFPGSEADSTAFSNVSLETFEQKTIATGCMNCHNATKLKTDFLWVLNTRAFPANVPAFLMERNEMSDLQDLLGLSRPSRRKPGRGGVE